MPSLGFLLWIDCIAAALAGMLVLAFVATLSALYAMPADWLQVIGVVNLLYACLSGSLAMRSRRPTWLICALSIANGTWASTCIGIAAITAGAVTAFGMAHLFVEAVLVGSLAVLEWRWRDQLARV